MKERTKRIGLMLGVIMMVAMAGTGTVFAAAPPVKTTKTAPASGVAEQKNKKPAKEEKKAEKSNKAEQKKLLYYGKVKKIETDKLILEEAEIVEKTDAAVDFENDSMKWKLNGKSIEIKTDKDTRYLKEMVPDKNKKGNDKKDSKVASDSQDTENPNEGIEMKNTREGALVRITLKDDESETAAEVFILSNVKETVKGKADKAGKTKEKA